MLAWLLVDSELVMELIMELALEPPYFNLALKPVDFTPTMELADSNPYLVPNPAVH